MTRGIKALALSCAVLLMVLQPARAAAPVSLQQAFDWQSKWGTIDFSADGTDPVIPSGQHPAKGAIKNAVKTYGTATDTTALSLIKTYNLDFDEDGIQDIVLDGSDYFKPGSDANNISQLCDENGCFLTIYHVAQPSQSITASQKDALACPVSAAENTTCRADCAATVQTCPALYTYNMSVIYDLRVLGWNTMSAADYRARIKKLSMYRVMSGGPVLQVVLTNPNCTNEEISLNGTQCVKYYQYVATSSTEGSFVDLYQPQPDNAGNYSTIFTYTPFDVDTAVYNVRGLTNGNGPAHRLAHGGTIDEQLATFAYTNKNGQTSAAPVQYQVPNAPAGFAAFHITNTSGNDYFVPMNTDVEFSAFINNAPAGVTVLPEELKFTAWSNQVCPTAGTVTGSASSKHTSAVVIFNQIPCDTPVGTTFNGTATINGVANVAFPIKVATHGLSGAWEGDGSVYTIPYSCSPASSVLKERYCQSSTSAYRNCSGCVTTKQPAPTAPAGADKTLYTGDYTQGCEQPLQCPAVISGVGSASHCLAGDAMISLPDGTTQALNELKAGTMVLGFGKNKGALKPVKIDAIVVTESQHTMKINDKLSLTPDHVVVTGDNKRIISKNLKVGDTLMQADGKAMKIETIENMMDKGTVYNLKLDNAAGFVADGVRVLSAHNSK